MVLLCAVLSKVLGEPDCVTLDVAPQVCGVLDAFELPAERFGRYIEEVVPVNDVSGQAACGPGLLSRAARVLASGLRLVACP